jgi:glycosyltransferase involved in cell wall biosynthesis/SAM-dependent methyltransferase
MRRYDSECIVCGAREFIPFGQRTDGVHVLQCTRCGHGIVEQFQENVQSLYGDDYFSGPPDSVTGYQEYAETAEHSIAWAPSLLRILKPRGRVLDIGCANGLALQLLGEGYECFGIELNDSMAEEARRSGVHLIAHDLLDSSLEQSYAGWFDAALAIAVFEHIPDFKEAFRTATALLKPDGILIFEVPVVQVEGDIWYRTSLEHLHYPTKSSIEYLFREILHLPLTGTVIDVQDFGCTYIGLTSLDVETARRAGDEYLRLTTTEPALLRGDEARFRWLLDLMHSAKSRPEVLALYRHVKPEDMRPASLRRLFDLWAYREEKMKSGETYRREIEQAKLWLEEQTRRWEQVAAQREEAIAASACAKTVLEQQVRKWQEVAEQRKRALAAYEASESQLEEQLRNLQQIAEKQRQKSRELEAANTSLAESLDNQCATLTKQSERIALLEGTVANMRTTWAWRSVEWANRVLRAIFGTCRGILLVASPRLAASNAKNLLLGMKLVLSGGAGPSTWSAHFDASYYKQANPDIVRTGIPPWLHYLLCGYLENRNPSASFDSAYYRSRHPDVRDAGINPLLHYAMFGHQEDRIQTPPVVRRTPRVLVHAPLEIPVRPWSFAAEKVLRTVDSDRPLVSVVIPCFNYGQYVEQAIRSVLSQTFTNLEIIVVEGGSTDGTTPQILRALEQSGLPRTRFVYRTEPHLAGDNRNFGIGLARGRYVCCLDADDLIKPTYVEIAIFLAEFGGYDMVYPSVSCFQGSDFCWLLSDPTWPEIADGNQASTVAMFRKAAWEHVGGFRDWGKGDQHVPEDWEFWVRLIGHGFSGKSIREPLMLYRVHQGGLWGTCELPIEQQRKAIREANPQLFVDGRLPATQSFERSVASWERLSEPAAPHGPILIALPFITIGGAEKLFATLVQSLVGRGYKVVVITTLVLAKTIRDCTDSFEVITPHLFPLPRVLQNQEECWKDFLFYLLKRHGIGAILMAGCNFVYQLLPEIAHEFPGIAVLDQLFNDEIHYPTNRRYASYIDTTLVPSPTLADKLISGSGEQADKVCVIPHGINIEEMTAPDATFESSGLPESFRGRFLVSFFGRLSAEKSPADFVKIARHLRSYDEMRFLMTGEGQERASVLALIEKYELQDCIHVPGFVDNLHDLIALSDVVVVPSSVDGMPLVVFEAQAFSKPVVASAVGSIPSVISDGKTGFLCAPGNVKAFAARIVELWRSPDLRRVIGDAARVSVCTNHSAESMTTRYVEALDKARSGRRRRSQSALIKRGHTVGLS